MNCVNCKIKCDIFSRKKQDTINMLLNIEKNISDLLFFFQYLSPNISSNLSLKINKKQSEKILALMLSNWKEKEYKFIDNLEEDTIGILNLENIYSKCKRIVCVKNKTESNFTCLMRHIRNSIAHGRIYIIKNNTYYKLLFEDFDRNSEISARIIINHAILKKWKNIIIEEIGEIYEKD